jgi:hypothetical protein
MYFGTGEGWFNIDAIRGFGIFKSIDGGSTWNRLTATTANFKYVQDLLIDRNGNLFASTSQAVSTDLGGIFKSTDKGSTFTQVLGSLNGGFGSSARGADLEMGSNGDIYATLGTSGSNGGIYASNYSTNTTATGNAGTWVNITPNATGTIATPSSLWQRIEIACAPSDTNVVYALFQGRNSDNCTSIQRFNKQTNSWSVKTVPTIIDQGNNSNFTRSQAWYDLVAAVDPNNADRLYIGGIDALRSINGGNSWTQMTTWSLSSATGFTSAQLVHADQHAIIYAPASSSRAIWGTDGGIHYTINADTAAGKPIFNARNNGYNVTQYYGVAMHPTLTNYFLAGAQDNGSHKFTSAGINAVQTATGGDGMFSHIDQNNGNIQITSYTNNNYYISIDNGATFSSRSFSNTTGSFVNPTDYDNNKKVLYAFNTAAVAATDSTPFVPGTYLRWNNPATGGTSTTVVSVPQLTGAITHVAVSPLTPNRVFFGLNNGSVVRVDDAANGTAKTGKIIRTGPGSVSVSCVAIDPANENHLLVTYSNYGTTSVYETNNAEAATPVWTSVEGNLPDMPVRWAMFDPRSAGGALLATELGIWSTDNLNSGGGTDWQPTNSGLANVRVDMLEYRAVDRTIAAATHGRGLFTAVVPALTTTDVNFLSGIASSPEATTTAIDCRSYRDYLVKMTVTKAATGTATVTLGIDTSSTAKLGIDYDFTTNGNFTSASNRFSFNEADTQNITIRVYDDAEVETDEFVKFNYTLSGGSDAQRGAGFQTLAFNITDNDFAPILPTTTTANYTIGTNSLYLSNSAYNAPFDQRLTSRRTQILYTAAELTRAGLRAGVINNIQLQMFRSVTSRAYSNTIIKMGLTSRTTLVDGSQFYVIPTNTVKNSFSYTPRVASGYTSNTISLDAPFTWNGTSSIAIEICYNNSSPDSTVAASSVDQTVGYTDGSTSTQGNMIWQNNIDCSSDFTGASGFGYFSSGAKPTITFNSTTTNEGTLAATESNSSRTEYLSFNNDLYYYSNGMALARIRNLSNNNFGCTQVVIDRAGDSAKSFWSTNTATYVMDKTFRILPTTNYSAGNYSATFYFSIAEKQGWERVTGQSFANIKVIKLPGQISSVSPTNREPDGAGTVEVITPTAVGAIGNIFYVTATFNTGFSGFGFGIPSAVSLPITLLDFKGRLQGDYTFLEWSTSAEVNSKEFQVEKSLDGIFYRPFATVKAAGNSATERAYSTRDNEKAVDINYYRLNMIDLDGQKKFSNVVILKNSNIASNISVINNPFDTYLNLRLTKIPAGKIRLTLSDASGKQIQSEYTQVAQGQTIYKFNVKTSTISKGIYFLTADAEGHRYSMKVMKQ